MSFSFTIVMARNRNPVLQINSDDENEENARNQRMPTEEDLHALFLTEMLMQVGFPFLHSSHPGREILHDLFQNAGPKPKPRASQESIDALIVKNFLSGEPIENCPICQDVCNSDEIVVSMPCKHDYHKPCLLEWLKEHNSCPVCRFELETDDAEYNAELLTRQPSTKTTFGQVKKAKKPRKSNRSSTSSTRRRTSSSSSSSIPSGDINDPIVIRDSSSSGGENEVVITSPPVKKNRKRKVMTPSPEETISSSSSSSSTSKKRTARRLP